MTTSLSSEDAPDGAVENSANLGARGHAVFVARSLVAFQDAATMRARLDAFVIPAPNPFGAPLAPASRG